MLEEEALKFAAMGWYVFPLKPKSKYPYKGTNGHLDASCDLEIVKEQFSNSPDSNIGGNCKRSGLVVIDIDPRNFGDETWGDLCKKHNINEETVTSLTGGGGRHLFYRLPRDIELSGGNNKLGLGVDVKIDGYVVLPPSIHESGKPYIWEVNSTPGECQILEFPQCLVDLLKKSKLKPNNANTGNFIPVGQRNERLFGSACAMQKRGFAPESIKAALMVENDMRCKEPIEEKEIDAIVKSSNRYEPDRQIEGLNLNDFELTDLGMAKAMAMLYGEDLRYCHPLKNWFIWNEKFWEPDTEDKIRLYPSKTIDEFIRHIADISDSSIKNKRMGQIIKAQDTSAISGIINETKPLLPISPEILDSEDWLLNCQNGTIELKSGDFRQQAKNDYFTGAIPIHYDKSAVCHLWDSFLNDIMLGKQQMIRFLQKICGYCLTGDISEQYIFILYGSGNNGKSTFQAIVMRLLGIFAKQSAQETFLKKKFDQIPCDLVRLRGARMVASGEIERGRHFDESLIKLITGGEKIAVRTLYREPIEYRPTYKVFFNTNHKPIISETTPAIWRRMQLIPFDFDVLPFLRDEHLADKLALELPGILNWALEGCLLWQQEGLEPPQEVKEATETYREEMDILAGFLQEYCVIDDSAEVVFADLYRKYKEECGISGDDVLTQKSFGSILTEKGFVKQRRKTGARRTVYRGIGLKA